MPVRTLSSSRSPRRVAIGLGVVGLCLAVSLVAHRVGLIAESLQSFGPAEAQASGVQTRLPIVRSGVACVGCEPAVADAPPLRRSDVALMTPRAKPSVLEKTPVIPAALSTEPLIGDEIAAEAEPAGLVAEDEIVEPAEHVSLRDDALVERDENVREDTDDGVVVEKDDRKDSDRDCDDRGGRDLAENEHGDRHDRDGYESRDGHDGDRHRDRDGHHDRDGDHDGGHRGHGG